MNILIDETFKSNIQNLYLQIDENCKQESFPDYIYTITENYINGCWQDYMPLIELIPAPIDDKVIVDFGCKYGHTLPIFTNLGAQHAIGLDAEDEYVETGQKIFASFDNIQIEKTASGFIPLQAESVDIVFVDEVISHVAPAFLDNVYSEISRILRPGGIILISDGNNLGNLDCRNALNVLYKQWELGPDGTNTDRDFVGKSFLTRRKEILAEHFPDLPQKEIDYISENTSGLFGGFLIKTAQNYVDTNILIKRPYREGIFPTNPGVSGVVMERAFYPLQVIGIG